MNRELFSVRATDAVEIALEHVVALRISGAPVVDEWVWPLGVISLKDLLRDRAGLVSERMTSPAVVIHRRAPIEQAGRLLAEAGIHRLVVVNDEETAFVSSPRLARASSCGTIRT